GDFCTTDGSLVNCTLATLSLTSQASGTLQGAQFPALTGDVTTSAGSLATSIGAAKVTNAMLAGSIAASKLVGTDIATVGTIASGTWNGTTIGVAYGGTGAGTAFTAGSVVYAGTSGVYSQDNSNFFWDATNHRLGIGTTSPGQKLSVSG